MIFVLGISGGDGKTKRVSRPSPLLSSPSSKIPLKLMGKNEIESHNKANEELSKIFYTGSTKKGKF